MPELNALDVDDAIMQGGAQANQWLGEVADAYEEPAREAQAAGLWNKFLTTILPGIPAAMAEQKLRDVDPQAYDNAKKRFMEGMKNGATK